MLRAAIFHVLLPLTCDYVESYSYSSVRVRVHFVLRVKSPYLSVAYTYCTTHGHK